MLSKNEVREQIISIAKKAVTKLKDVDIGSTTFEDLGIDSLDLVEIFILVEEEMEVSVTEEETEKLKTFDDVVTLFHKKVNKGKKK